MRGGRGMEGDDKRCEMMKGNEKGMEGNDRGMIGDDKRMERDDRSMQPAHTARRRYIGGSEGEGRTAMRRVVT